jgi:NAD(P)-dependent dehydrogenase (short-subunit alcohol dehydrogenase family)
MGFMPSVTMRATGAAAAALAAIMMIGSPAFGQSAAEAPSLQGKTVMITGSTDGLGREVALRVAARGAHVIVHGRNQERGRAVVEEIAKAGRGSARFYAADLASLAEVRTLAQAILRDHDRLDVLVNNAGVLLRDRQVSQDGHELHFAVNYLSGFLLTRMLLPRLVAGAPSRIVNVASVAQSPIDFDDVMLERPGRAGQGYGQSKLAQIMFTIDLAEELDGRNVSVTALHPATMMDTSMVREAGMKARASVSEGADAVMRQITGPDVQSGQYYNGQQAARANAQAYDEAARARLRQLSMRLTGLDSSN